MLQKVSDEWEVALKNIKIELEACQKDQHVQSCMKCQKLLECTLRESYVKAVYDSMSKGTGGGFEF